jgi:hypothetical protein
VDKEVKKIRLEDGRNAERHTIDEGNQRTIELYAEDQRPLKLEKRVVEKVKPVVYERTIQSIQDGNVVEEKVEALEPKVDLQLREHLGVAQNSALGVSPYVTKNELVNTVVEAVKALRMVDVPQPVPMQTDFTAQSFVPRNIQDEIADRLSNVKKDGIKTTDMVLTLAVIGNFGFLLFLIARNYFGF